VSGELTIREQPVPADAPAATRAWLSRFQLGVLTSIRALSQFRIVQGVHLEGVVVTAGVNALAHKLSRQPRGWVVTRQSAELGLFETAAQLNQRNSRALVLTATVGGTVDLWVF
jgi:hypothetical protein